MSEQSPTHLLTVSEALGMCGYSALELVMSHLLNNHSVDQKNVERVMLALHSRNGELSDVSQLTIASLIGREQFSHLVEALFFLGLMSEEERNTQYDFITEDQNADDGVPLVHRPEINQRETVFALHQPLEFRELADFALTILSDSRWGKEFSQKQLSKSIVSFPKDMEFKLSVCEGLLEGIPIALNQLCRSLRLDPERVQIKSMGCSQAPSTYTTNFYIDFSILNHPTYRQFYVLIDFKSLRTGKSYDLNIQAEIDSRQTRNIRLEDGQEALISRNFFEAFLWLFRLALHDENCIINRINFENVLIEHL